MKKTLLIILLLGITSQVFSQEITENKVDEFTGDIIKKTSWETLTMSMKHTAYFRFSEINDSRYLEIKLMIGSGNVFSIDKGNELMMKMENEDLLKLNNLKYKITCHGCGAKGHVGSKSQGIHVYYPLNDENWSILKNNTPKKVRLYLSDSYIEFTTKSKHTKLINLSMELMGN